MVQTNNDCRFWIFALTSSLHQLRLLAWKIRFKTQASSCSDFPSEAMLWIKEVEMVDSVDELKSSRSIVVKKFPNFELLDARIASALNKVIQNSHFRKKRWVWRNRKLRKRTGLFEEDRSLTWFTTTFESLALMIPFIRDGVKFFCLWPRSRLVMLWKVVQIDNTRIWSTPKPY